MLDILIMFVNKIKKLIGTTADTGGTSTAGTMMAKLNNLISNNASTNIGSTTDGGASTITGTVMGKLNNLISSSVDTNIIKAGTNYQSLLFQNFTTAQKEILNINGAGFVDYLEISAGGASDTIKMTVYVDDVLLMSFNTIGYGVSKTINFGVTDAHKLIDLSQFVNLSDTGAITISTANLLEFKTNLRIVINVSKTGSSVQSARVKYGLVG